MKKKQLNTKLLLQKQVLARLNDDAAETVKGGADPQTCNGGPHSFCVILESNLCPSRPRCVFLTLQPDCVI